MMMDGECSGTFILTYFEYYKYSINAKADPLEQPKRRAQSPSVYAAAMEEFRNGGYQGSDPSEEV